jgi:hypothetical protein
MMYMGLCVWLGVVGFCAAPVEQVMAESKAREQTLSAEAVDKAKQHHIVKSAVDVLGLADDQKPETSQAHCSQDDLAEMANINNKHDKIQLSKGTSHLCL